MKPLLIIAGIITGYLCAVLVNWFWQGFRSVK